MIDLPFLFLVGGTMVAMMAQLFALSMVLIIAFDFPEPFMVPAGRAIFLGTVTGVFVAAVWPYAQPPVTALIVNLLMLTGIKNLDPRWRPLLMAINGAFAFVPMAVRAASGV